MARSPYRSPSLTRRLRQLVVKNAALILGCALCGGAAIAFAATTSEPAVEIERLGLDGDVQSTSGERDEATSSTSSQLSSEDETTSSASEEAPAIARIHVDGAVANPGVYELSGEDIRVTDAVEAAGGLTGEADLTSVNLAAQVRDAEKVHIPAQGEVPEASAGSPTGTASGGSSTSNPEGLIDINRASAEELCELPGVGEATAQKIIAERESGGPFSSPEDLMRVSGIGEKKFASLKDLICV